MSRWKTKEGHMRKIFLNRMEFSILVGNFLVTRDIRTLATL
jgi:hypothetical protein